MVGDNNDHQDLDNDAAADWTPVASDLSDGNGYGSGSGNGDGSGYGDGDGSG